MWNAIAMYLKVKQLQEKYPDTLGTVTLQVPETGSVGGSSLYPSTIESMSSGLSADTSSISSDGSHVSQSETTKGRHFKILSNFVLGPARRVALGDSGGMQAPLTASTSLEILQALVMCEDLDQMLQYFMSQILIRMSKGLKSYSS